MQNIIKLDLSKELKNIYNKDKQYTIPIFIPHLGCKNECIFCNQNKISGVKDIQNLDEIKKEIDNKLQYINNDKKIQIAFFGGSFTGLPINEQISYLKLANEYIKNNIVDSIRISTRPDYINVNILKLLKKYNVKTIELGVQSMDDEVLKTAKRGHSKTDVIRAAILINLYKFELGFQIMIGLPKSDVKKEVKTMKQLLKFNPKQLRIYPVYVLNNSELYNLYKENKYVPLSLEQAVDRTSKVIEVCNNSDVQIIRIGLQSTNEITESNEELIGPKSDNFAEYALAKIVVKKIEKEIKKNIENEIKNIYIYVDKKYISIAVGPKKTNKIYLENKYNVNILIKGV